MNRLLLTFVMASIGYLSLAQGQSPLISCQQDKVRLDARSKELQEIVKEDQSDRANWENKTPEQMLEVAIKDVERRKRVGEIFGEGCFSKAEDYAAAALVYQHGDTPDHYFQTFIWSKRGVELGDAKQKQMMALGIDRYLVNIGHKQLFGSQANRPGPNQNTCWCLEQIEKTFPDRRRSAESGRTITQAYEWLKELNRENVCPTKECKLVLKPSPKGTVPGYW